MSKSKITQSTSKSPLSSVSSNNETGPDDVLFEGDVQAQQSSLNIPASTAPLSTSAPETDRPQTPLVLTSIQAEIVKKIRGFQHNLFLKIFY